MEVLIYKKTNVANNTIGAITFLKRVLKITNDFFILGYFKCFSLFYKHELILLADDLM